MNSRLYHNDGTQIYQDKDKLLAVSTTVEHAIHIRNALKVFESGMIETDPGVSCLSNEDLRKLLEEARDSILATTDENGISDARKEYRKGLVTRINIALDTDKRPQRRFSVLIKAGGDTRGDLIDAGNELSTSLDDNRSGVDYSTIMGCPTRGGYLKLTIDPDMTRSKYFEEMSKHKEQIRNSKPIVIPSGNGHSITL